MKLLLLGLLLLSARPLAAQEACTLGRVIDGDTFECQDGRRVRLLFVDAPEREQPGGASATAALKRHILPGDVLRLDSGGLDRYGRTLAYLWRDTMFVNRWLVEEGHAVVEDYGDDPWFPAVLIRAEREPARRPARPLGRGSVSLPDARVARGSLSTAVALINQHFSQASRRQRGSTVCPPSP